MKEKGEWRGRTRAGVQVGRREERGGKWRKQSEGRRVMVRGAARVGMQVGRREERRGEGKEVEARR